MNDFERSLISEDRRRRGLVIILPGIEGYSCWNRNLLRGFASADVPYSIEIFDWTCGWRRLFYNLQSDPLHCEKSIAIAEKIVAYRRQYPAAPVYLVGHSGGGGMTLKSLERLPNDQKITGAILLGVAVSPEYDYRPALSHIEKKLWNFTSLADCVILGLFTKLAGTIDEKKSICAGMVGFSKRELTVPEADLFCEMPYRSEYMFNGNFAGHFGFTARSFTKHRLAPLILTNEERVTEVSPLPLLDAYRKCIPNTGNLQRTADEH
ncbi:alpha/beta hydrolase [Planctomicrobium sp. SH668]|uniref:alpha/beta hydrolase n=1 Tax=Planctomicrobium sp. SH668 TaxID=3448126 RepID=UPI003F5BFBB5